MVGMNVCVEDAGDLPPMAPRQVEIYLRVKRGIDHHGLLACINEVRKASFSCAPHLDDTDVVRRHRYFSSVPAQTPGLHAAVQRQRLQPASLQLRGRPLPGFASPTPGHARSIPPNPPPPNPPP